MKWRTENGKRVRAHGWMVQTYNVENEWGDNYAPKRFVGETIYASNVDVACKIAEKRGYLKDLEPMNVEYVLVEW